MTEFKVACEPVSQPPAYISSRSANSLLSFSRPTRIQAVALYYLNKVLDELLLHILSAAKSLATDRIKSDGILRVLGGQHGIGSGAGAQLAKNAVLEAELELRTYLDGQRKEGGKMPLGLSATSRYDGTVKFPIESAYKTLRIRCQYYCTLGELEDPAPQASSEQNIMSADGRPIATVTPGVAIYVTALLEHVAEHILQSVARVIERDNRDEASLSELVKALEEDEGTYFCWSKFHTRREMLSQAAEGSRGGAKVQKPWQVPLESELDQAAGRKKMQRQSLAPSMTTADSESHLEHDSRRDSVRPASSASQAGHISPVDRRGSTSGSGAMNSDALRQSTASPEARETPPLLRRRSSFDKAARFFAGKRRGSRSSQELRADSPFLQQLAAGAAAQGSSQQNDVLSNPSEGGGDTFDSLVMSGQTMKVSLTPNRLRSMVTANDDGDEERRKGVRKRPGTTLLPTRQDADLDAPTSNGKRASLLQRRSVSTSGKENQSLAKDGSGRPVAVRGSSQRSVPKGAPPSAYRGLDAHSPLDELTDPLKAHEIVTTNEERSRRAVIGPESSQRRSSSHVRDMTELFNGRRPGTADSATGDEAQPSAADASSSKLSALSAATGKVLSRFSRKSSYGPPSPARKRESRALSLSTSENGNTSIDAPMTGPKQSNGSNHSHVGRDRIGSGASTPITPSDSLHDRLDSTTGNDTQITATTADTTLHEEPEEGDEASPKNKPVPELPPATSGERLATEQVQNPQDTSQTVTGAGTMYQQPQGNESNSTVSSKARVGETRKNGTGAWAYHRPSSASGRRQSLPYHGGQRVVSGSSTNSDNANGAPPSAWTNTAGLGVMTGASITTRTPASPAQSLRATSPAAWSPQPSKTDVARILAQLNARMKDAMSVEECQRLVMQALAVTAAAVHNDTAAHTSDKPMRSPSPPAVTADESPRAPDVTGEDSAQRPQTTDAAEGHENRDSPAVPPKDLPPAYRTVIPASVPQSAKYRSVALPMSIGYNIDEDSDLPRNANAGLIAAWLLGGDEGFSDQELAIKQENEQPRNAPESSAPSAPSPSALQRADSRTRRSGSDLRSDTTSSARLSFATARETPGRLSALSSPQAAVKELSV